MTVWSAAATPQLLNPLTRPGVSRADWPWLLEWPGLWPSAIKHAAMTNKHRRFNLIGSAKAVALLPHSKGPYKHLTFWVLLAVVVGVLIGALAKPEDVDKLKPLAELFILTLKYFVAPLIFLTVTQGIASMGDLKRVGQIGGKALIYFEVVTTFCATDWHRRGLSVPRG